MKKTTVLIFCLVLASLACLSTSGASVTDQQLVTVQHVYGEKPFAVGELEPVQVVTVESTLARCAVVTADTALHLRSGSSVQDDVLTWILSGDVVALLDDANPEWWKVERGTITGYARSSYLREVECVK
jgi:uncharacterized protein YgiM (DUF1202 family)